MGHAYIAEYVHVVFSTKGRLPQIREDLERDMWRYIAGIAKQNGFKALEVGGMPDHVHALLSLKGDGISKAVQFIKGGSSKWFRETHPEFHWQEGYGAFTLGVSQLDATVEYIRNQKEHHKKIDYRTEFIAFLKKHGVEYDERYVLG